jgi:hypothetical protein
MPQRVLVACRTPNERTERMPLIYLPGRRCNKTHTKNNMNMKSFGP